jgi:2-polyprenyl-6-methoxyphenol hydroxylase-like FAD-dependent oxidoreductase
MDEVIILGAGIGSPTLGLALQQAGLPAAPANPLRK